VDSGQPATVVVTCAVIVGVATVVELAVIPAQEQADEYLDGSGQ